MCGVTLQSRLEAERQTRPGRVPGDFGVNAVGTSGGPSMSGPLSNSSPTGGPSARDARLQARD